MCLPGETLETLDEEAAAWAFLEPWDVRPDNATMVRHAGYRFRARWATRWHEGRIFVAGDAAHQTPPFAGQGMCAGLRDAANLAWKLDYALGHSGATALLDTYDAERIPQAAAVIEVATELGKVICIPDPDKARNRDGQMAPLVPPGGSTPAPPMPGIAGGLLTDSALAGELFMQASVRAGGAQGLLDDVVGPGWHLVTNGQPGRTRRRAGQLVRVDRRSQRRHRHDGRGRRGSLRPVVHRPWRRCSARAAGLRHLRDCHPRPRCHHARRRAPKSARGAAESPVCVVTTALDLTNRVIAVTGSTSGIGEVLARLLAACGAAVVVNSARSAAAGLSLAEELPDALYVAGDIADPGTAEALVGAVGESLGPARWPREQRRRDNRGPAARHRRRDARAVGTRPFGQRHRDLPRLTGRVAPPRESDDGWIINVTSIAGVRQTGSSLPYAVSKAAVDHLTTLLAKFAGGGDPRERRCTGTGRHALDRGMGGTA